MRLAALILFIAIMLASGAGATEIYRWTDADGVVHFSDTAPEDGGAEALTVQDTTPSDYDPESDPYSILNQARRTSETLARLEKERETREKERRERVERIVVYDRRPGFSFVSARWPYVYAPVLPGQRPIRQRRVLASQWRALEETGLTGPRPASINSGVHYDRVQRSQALPLAGGKSGH